MTVLTTNIHIGVAAILDLSIVQELIPAITFLVVVFQKFGISS